MSMDNLSRTAAFSAQRPVRQVIPAGPARTSAEDAVTALYQGQDAEFSARTGRLLSVFDLRRTRANLGGAPSDVLWASPTGSVLVVFSPAGHNQRLAVLAGDHLTLLPQSATAQSPAAAW